MSTSEHDAIVIGAGFAGLYMTKKLVDLGFAVRGYEAGSGVGGTWFWNRYPGARCDVESLDYQYSFSDDLQREWDWSERFATQPEILSYIDHVADRFDLRRHFQFNTRIVSAAFNDADRTWRVTTDSGEQRTARWLIAATGCLSAPIWPDVPGLGSFSGDRLHTGRWPHEGYDFRGKHVGVIGTGSSGIQLIPCIAEQADHVYVFQRTANYSLPARNRALTDDDRQRYRRSFAAFKDSARRNATGIYTPPERVPTQSALDVPEAERTQRLEKGWDYGGPNLHRAFTDVVLNEQSNRVVAEFIRQKIRETVKDPVVAEALSPDYLVATKRICVDSDYYSTFNRPNVTLVDVRKSPLHQITAAGAETTAARYDFDTLVFATGYDAMTGPLLSIDVRGKGGRRLVDAWSAGPQTYLGLGVSGFPNLFIVAGPGSPSVLANMVMCIEQHVDWIGDCLDHLRQAKIASIEVNADAQTAWVEHVNEVAARTLLPKGNSWFLGANVPGKPRVFMPYVGGLGAYAERCRVVQERGYEGFTLAGS